MEPIWIILGILAIILVVVITTAYICFHMVFYSPKRKPYADDECPIPNGAEYLPFKEDITATIKKLRTIPCRDVEIKSFDGLTLRGKYYEQTPGAHIELMMHGYRGDSVRDMSVGVFRCFAMGGNALVIDHRGSGRSDGRVISFGVNESRDAERWVQYILDDIDKDAKIILTGISMGAATAMITAGKDLPNNVVAALADCGYTSAKDIIKKVIRDMHLPPNILYPFVRLGGLIFGRFDVDETSPIEAMAKARIPVIFFHGTSDDFVPHEMSQRNFDACVTDKRMVSIDGAAHGLAYMVDPDKYLAEFRTFFAPILGSTDQ